MDETLPLTFTVEETISPETFPLDAFYRFNHKLPYKWFTCTEPEIESCKYITAPPNYRAQDIDDPGYHVYKQYFNSAFVLQEFHKLVTEARLNRTYQYSDGKQMAQALPSSVSIEGYELLLDGTTVMCGKLSTIRACLGRCRQAKKAIVERQKQIDEHINIITTYRRVAPLVLESRFLQLALTTDEILMLSEDLGKYLRCKRSAVRVCLPNTTLPLTRSLASSKIGSCTSIKAYMRSCNIASAFIYLQRYFILMYSSSSIVDLNEITIGIGPGKPTAPTQTATYCTVKLFTEQEGQHSVGGNRQDGITNSSTRNTSYGYVPSDFDLSVSEESDTVDITGDEHEALPDMTFMLSMAKLNISLPPGSLNPSLITGVLKMAHIKEENPINLIQDLLNVHACCVQRLKTGDRIVLDTSFPHRVTMVNGQRTHVISSKDGVLCGSV